MYSTCLYCHGSLGTNEVIEALPVGRRVAYDAARGRLWMVCRKCERWNLTPLEERWEAMDECERRFRGTRVRVQTENIGLARLSEGLELVRVGRPLWPEFAAWRYGDQFGRRRRRAVVAGGVGATAAVAAAPVALAAYGFASVLFGGWVATWGSLPYAMVKEYVTRDRVVTRIPTETGRATVRVRHLRDSALVVDGTADEVSLDLFHDCGRTVVGGDTARRAFGRILAYSNLLGGTGG